jgi:hypothetical protein
MSDVARLIEEHLRNRCSSGSDEPDFGRCLTISDKFEAHGMGIILEELMSQAEILESQQSAG